MSNRTSRFTKFSRLAISMLAIVFCAIIIFSYIMLIRSRDFDIKSQEYAAKALDYSESIERCDMGISLSKKRSESVDNADSKRAELDINWWVRKQHEFTAKREECQRRSDYYAAASRYPWLYPNIDYENMPNPELLPPPDLPVRL